ncbi:MAG: BolA/IbaG family iron-sulfur metabolism protein [Cyanobacteria bacterium P01_F01_bin.33]
MSPQTVRTLIETALPGAIVEVLDPLRDGEHLQAVVVSERFAGLTMLQQHRLVYSGIQTHIDTGELHALQLQTYTPDQWNDRVRS